MASNYELKLTELEKTDKPSAGKLKGFFKSEMKSINKEEYEDLLRMELQIEGNHRAIVNAIVSLFDSAKELGYKYITVEPLYQIDGEKSKTFDILFAKYEKEAAKILLVEVKSSMSNIGKEISSFEETKKIFFSKKEFFEELVGESISDAEFIFAVPLSSKDSLIKHLKDNSILLKDFIVWSVDFFKREIIEIKQTSNHGEERKNRRVHQDSCLDSLFSGKSYINYSRINFTPTSHIVHILEIIYQEIYHRLKQNKPETNERNFFFAKEIVQSIIDDHPATNNLSEDQRVKFVSLIMSMGVDYRIWHKISERDYKLKNTSNPYDINNFLSKSYAEKKIYRDCEKAALLKFDLDTPEQQKKLF